MADKRVELKMPNLGNGVDTAIVAEWLVDIGEQVREGEPVVTIETDKATSDVVSPTTGILLEVLAVDGAEVSVGETIGVFGAE